MCAVALIEVEADAVPLGRHEEVGRVFLRLVAECGGPELGCTARIIDLQHHRFCTDSHPTPPRGAVETHRRRPDVKAHSSVGLRCNSDARALRVEPYLGAR